LKALYCGGCGDLIGMPQDDRFAPIRECGCGRVRARWADPAKGLIVFNETLDPFPSGALARIQELAKERRLVRVRRDFDGLAGEALSAAVDEAMPTAWHAAWDELDDLIAPVLKTDLRAGDGSDAQGSLRAWLVGVNNSVLRGAHRSDSAWGRAPNYLEYRDWMSAEGTKFKQFETNIIRCRPGDSSDSKLVAWPQLLGGRWE